MTTSSNPRPPAPTIITLASLAAEIGIQPASLWRRVQRRLADLGPLQRVGVAIVLTPAQASIIRSELSRRPHNHRGGRKKIAELSGVGAGNIS